MSFKENKVAAIGALIEALTCYVDADALTQDANYKRAFNVCTRPSEYELDFIEFHYPKHNTPAYWDNKLKEFGITITGSGNEGFSHIDINDQRDVGAILQKITEATKPLNEANLKSLQHEGNPLRPEKVAEI